LAWCHNIAIFKKSYLKENLLSSAALVVVSLVSASVTIANTVKVAGKVSQLYLNAPANKLPKPTEKLKAFAKTELLQPGKSQIIQFLMEAKDLASFDTNSTSWIAEAEKYTAKLAASSANLQQTTSSNLPKELMVEKFNKVLVPPVEINELKK